MGLRQSKDELLYEQVSNGNIDGIKSLRAEGACLEYLDKEGKTPLIVACMSLPLYNVAKTLVELGANVNAYRPGRNGGTPLHHASKQGLEDTVKLLLSHGANALLMNDDCQTPLEVARAKGFTNVVRIIESHICLYSGWLRELYGLGFLELLAPQFLSRKVWVVVLPCGSRNLNKPFKLELAVYATTQDAQPRTSISLWRASMEEPNFDRPDPSVVISETSTIARRRRRTRLRPRQVIQARVKLAPVDESDKEQLRRFCSACKGIPQVMHSNFPFNTTPPIAHPSALSAVPSTAPLEPAAPTGASSSGGFVGGSSTNYQNAPPPENGGSSKQPIDEAIISTVTSSVDTEAPPLPTPSAPAISNEVLPDGPIHYPDIDSSPIDLLNPPFDNGHDIGDANKNSESSTCVICLDSPAEGACVPCGHMAGCMSCLNEIKLKKWGCPVCRTQIQQVIKVYSV